MSRLIQAIILISGVFVFVGDAYLLLHKKIEKKISILWLFGSMFAILFGLFPGALDALAYAMGVHYPPALFFMMAIVLLLQINLLHSMEINRLKTELKELTQIIAIDKVVVKSSKEDEKRMD